MIGRMDMQRVSLTGGLLGARLGVAVGSLDVVGEVAGASFMRHTLCGAISRRRQRPSYGNVRHTATFVLRQHPCCSSNRKRAGFVNRSHFLDLLDDRAVWSGWFLRDPQGTNRGPSSILSGIGFSRGILHGSHDPTGPLQERVPRMNMILGITDLFAQILDQTGAYLRHDGRANTFGVER